MFKQTDTNRVLFVHTLRRLLLGLFVFLSVASVFVGIFDKSTSVNAAVNNTVNFQARLLGSAGNVAPDGNYNVEFKIYNALSSSGSSQGSCTGDAACLWSETRTGGNRVRVANGYMSVALGSVTAFPGTIDWSQEMWLTMNIGGSSVSASWDGEMNPRLRLTAVPYAMSAATAVRASTADILQNNGANASTLGWASQTATRTILLPDASGTVCLAGTEGCGFALNGGNTTGSAFTVGTNDNYGLNLEVNNTTVASFANTGAALFKNSTNSTAGFDIQNAGGSSLFTVSTAGNNISVGSSTNTNFVIYNSGANGAWATSSNPLPKDLNILSGATANGYIYALGGYSTSGGSQSAVYYARQNTDGSTSSWTTSSNPLPAVTQRATAVVSNGYIYVIGGYSASSAVSTVYYAKLNTDGSTGSWTTSSNPLPAIRSDHGAVAHNGYIYVFGGNDFVSTNYDTVRYARVNSDGSTSAWSSAPNLPATMTTARATVLNGYMYVTGGGSHNVYYSKINTDGTLATWTNSGNILPATRQSANMVSAGGYLYVVAGNDTATVFYAKGNPDGSTGSWTTSAAPLPTAHDNAATVVSNGYIYELGGWGTGASTNYDTVYYSKLQTTNVNGSAIFGGSVAGAEAQNTNEFTTLGQVEKLMAGAVNTLSSSALINGGNSFGGTLSVGTNDNYGMNFEVGGATVASLNSTGAALFKNTTNSGNAFLVQSATGDNVFNVDTTNKRVGVGTGTPLGDLHVQGTLAILGPVAYPVYFNTSPSSAYFTIDKSNTASDASIVMRDQGAVRAEIGITTDNNIHFKTVSGSAGSETFTDRMLMLTTGEVYVTGNFGVGTVPVERLHVAEDKNAGRVLAKIENTATSGSRAAGVQLSGGSANWTVGTDVGLNGSNNFAIQDNNFGYQPRLMIDGSGKVGLGTDTPTGSLSFGSGANKVININAAANNVDGDDLTIHAGNGTGASQVGGDLILQGGEAGGSGAGGGVIVKSQTNSANAFAIQNAGGTSLLNVDTASNGITLGSGGTDIAITNNGANKAWSLESDTLPANREAAATVTANGYIYAIGGDNGTTAQSTVYYAKLNSDGSTGTWSTNANALPAARSLGNAVVIGGYIYYMGGVSSLPYVGNAQSTVYYAKLNSDGSTGTWSTTTSMAAAKRGANVVTVNSYIYVMGGVTAGDTHTATVHYSKANADGTLGAWATGGDQSMLRGGAVAVAHNNYIYLAGGYGYSDRKDSVESASVNADGTLGAWTVVSTMPDATSSPVGAVVGGYLYVTGGWDLGALSDTHYAKINGDGTLGAWSTSASGLPSARYYAGRGGSVAYNGYMYVVGGANSSDAATSSVYYSALQRTTIDGSTQFAGSVSGADAVNSNEYVTLGQAGLLVGNAVGIATSSALLQGGNSFGSALTLGTNDNHGLNFEVNGGNVLTLSNTGAAVLQNTANSTSAFVVRNAADTIDVLVVDTATPGVTVNGSFTVNNLTGASQTIRPGVDSLSDPQFKVQSSLGNNAFTVGTSTTLTQVGIGLGGSNVPTMDGNGLEVRGSIRISGTSSDDVDTFTTPEGSEVTTRINVGLYNPGNFNQLVAMGLPNASSTTARVLSIFDARSGTNQSPLAIFSPNESQVLGMGWDGQNTRGLLKTTSSEIGFKIGTVNVGYFTSDGFVSDGDIWAGDALNVAGISTLNNQVNVREDGSAFRVQNAGADYTMIDANTFTGLQVNSNATFKNFSNSTTAFDIQNTSSQSLFLVDTTNSRVTIGSGVTTTLRIGDATNNTTFDSSTGAGTLNGNARRTRTIMLQPEYVGAILDAANDATCSSANSGTLTSSLDLTNRKNYYNWMSTSGSAQCYNIVVQVPIPTDFSAWATSTPLKVNAYTSNTSNGTANIELRDTTGSVIYNYVSVTPGSTSTWAQATVGTSISGTYTAGDYMTLRVRVSSQSSANIRLGAITMDYLSKW